MERSETISELVKALVKAQAAFEPAKKDKTNPHLKNKYADLASIIEASRPALTANGLAVTQSPTACQPGFVAVTTTLWHESGEYLQDTFSLPVAQANAQGYGSCLTYCKRYALASVLGVVADEDDDGNAASLPQGVQRGAPAVNLQAKRQAEAKKIAMDISETAKYYGQGEEWLKEVTGVASLRELVAAGNVEALDVARKKLLAWQDAQADTESVA